MTVAPSQQTLTAHSLEGRADNSFYLSRRLLKYSARAIIKDNIISNSTNVMYIVITSLQRN